MEHLYWEQWLEKLQQYRLTGLALTFLQGIAPVRYFLSQGLLAITPFVGQHSHSSWNQFATMLEDPTESRAFAGYLREKWI